MQLPVVFSTRILLVSVLLASVSIAINSPICLAATAPAVADSTPTQADPTEVDSFNLNAYMGRWFQYSESSSFAKALTWRFHQCVTYEHTLMSPADNQPLFFIMKRSMNVFHLFSKKRIRATPSMPNSNEYMTSPKGKRFTVIEVGPIVEGEYQYAVVRSSPSTLKILVRDLDFFESNYKQEVVEKLGLDVDSHLGLRTRSMSERTQPTQVKTHHSKYCRNNYAWNP